MAASATSHVSVVFGAINNLSRPMEQIAGSTKRLEKSFTRLSGAFQNAFQFYVRFRIFGLINRAIGALENTIPNLIRRGQEWAQTVDEIADSTGLAAERASILTGVIKVMGGDTAGLTKALGALAQQVVNHGDVLKRYGIETRGANGELLDTWTILKNVRNALADAGSGFIKTAAARDLLSRGGQTLLDFLSLTDKQFRLLMKDARESGIIMSEAGLLAADQWGRTQRRLEGTIDGIANQIVQGVQPLLTSLVDGITNYLRTNMTQIVGFVVEVVATVAHFLAALFDIDLGATTFAQEVDDAADKNDKRTKGLSKAAERLADQVKFEDALTASLGRQIAAIDRQLVAMANVGRAEDARREQARLLREITDARKELADLRGRSVFAAGMSAAEAELARQAHGADIIAGQPAIADAEERLSDRRR